MSLRSSTDTSGGLVSRAVGNAVRYPEVLYTLLWYVSLAFFLVTFLFPLYWLVVLSVTPAPEVYGLGLFPDTVTLNNYLYLFDPYGRRPFVLYVFNSLVISTIATVVVLLVGSLAGYAFGRLDFPGKGPLLIGVLCASYFPPASFLVPLFELFSGSVSVLGVGLDIYNSMWAIIFPLSGLSLPLSIFVLLSFFRAIPDTLEDAARVEGTTRVGALFRVILPLSMPGVATAAALTFITTYGEFFFSYLMTDGRAVHGAPMVPALLDLRQSDPVFAAAGSVFGLLPIVALLLLANERIVDGIRTSRSL